MSQSQHLASDAGSDTVAPRKSRRAVNPKKVRDAGPGRPKGSSISKITGLTPNQESIAEAIVGAELKSGLWPSSVKEICEVTGKHPPAIRSLLRRKDFQAYLLSLLELEGIVIEGSFWRGMALGLQAADPKVLDLYARMTGKIQPVKKETLVEVVIKSPDGKLALPEYTDEVIEGTIVDE